MIVRRGTAVLGRLSLSAVPERIQSNRLFASDRVSSDGKNWVRLDQHPQMKKYFSTRRSGRGGSDRLVTQVRPGAGKSKSGLLVTLLIILVIAYFLFR